nr:MFS transporter [Pseudomonas duriflava]
MDPPQRPLAVTLLIVSIVLFTFLAYLTIGIPLAVLPTYVHEQLGFSSIVAGLVISSQYLATLLSRSHAGKVVDTIGAKQAVLYGLTGCGISGVLMLLSVLLQNWPQAGLICLLLGRIILGCSESLVGTGAISWAIGRAGVMNTAKVISWNGIASYGALAVGAPLGVVLANTLGLWSMGASVILLAAVGLYLARPKPATPLVSGKRIPFRHVLGQVMPYGLGLALGGIGFGTIATFITLFYASRGWSNAALCLSLFGIFFICARLLFAQTINRYGGFRVAIVCFSVESVGLLLLWQADSTTLALAGAALTGFGFSLVFPALGVEAVRQVPDANRGAALAAYSVFIDLSLGITGPLIGAIATRFGYPSMFLSATAASIAGLILSIALLKRNPLT